MVGGEDHVIVSDLERIEGFLEMAGRLRVFRLKALVEVGRAGAKLRTLPAFALYGSHVDLNLGYDVQGIGRKAEALKGKGELAVKTDGRTREAIERIKPSFIYGMEEAARKDYIHQRGGGLDEVMVGLAVSKGVGFGFSFASLLLADQEKRAVLMARMAQNIRLCARMKARMVFCSLADDPMLMRNVGDVERFFSVICRK